MGRESFDVRRRHRLPFLLVPPASVDPLPGLRLLRGGGDHRHDLVPAGRLHQVQLQLRLSDTVEVAVPFDESGNHELSVEVDDLGRRADVALHSALEPSATMRPPRAASACTSAGVSSVAILAVQQHEIRRRRGLALRRRAPGAGEGRNDDVNTAAMIDDMANHATPA